MGESTQPADDPVRVSGLKRLRRLEIGFYIVVAVLGFVAVGVAVQTGSTIALILDFKAQATRVAETQSALEGVRIEQAKQLERTTGRNCEAIAVLSKTLSHNARNHANPTLASELDRAHNLLPSCTQPAVTSPIFSPSPSPR